MVERLFGAAEFESLAFGLERNFHAPGPHLHLRTLL